MFKKIMLVIMLLIIAAVTVVYYLLRTGDFVPYLTTELEQSLGRKVSLGEVSTSFYPWLGLRVSDVKVYNSKGFSPDVFVEAKALHIKAKLLPLFKQRLYIDKVRLAGLQAHLVQRKDGSNNWGLPENKAVEDPAQSAELPVFETTALQGIEITDGRVIFDNAGQRIKFADVRLDTGKISTGKPISGSLAMRYHPAQGAPVSVQAAGQLRLEADETILKNMRISLANIGSFSGLLRFNHRNQKLTVQSGKLTAPGLEAGIVATVDLAQSTPQTKATLDVKKANPKTLLSQFGLTTNTTKSAALSTAKGVLQIGVRGEKLSATTKKFQLDQSHLSGSVSVQGKEVVLQISGDKIVLDDYLPPDEGTHSAQVFPVKALKELAVAKSSLRFASLVYQGLKLTNAEFGIAAKQGLLQFTPVRASVFGGSYQGNIQLNVRKKIPVLHTNESLQNIAVQDLLTFLLETKLMDGKVWLSGKGNARVKVSLAGNTLADLTHNLNGTMQLNVKNGVLHGIDLLQTLQQAIALSEKKLPAKPATAGKTPITTLEIPSVAKQGVLYSEKIRVFTPALKVTGKGKTDLNSQQLDYTLEVELIHKDQVKDPGLKGLAGYQVPLRITGSFTEPKVRLDIAALLKAQAQHRLEAEKAKLQAEAKRKLEAEKAKLQAEAKRKLEAEKAKVKQKLEDKLKQKLKNKVKPQDTIKQELKDSLQDKLKGLL